MVGRPVHKTCVDLLDVGDAQVGRIVGELVPEDLDSPLDAVDAKHVTVHHGPANPDGLDAEGEEPERVGAVADAAVGQDLDLLKDLGGFAVDLESDLKRRRAAVEVATSVVGKDDGGNLVLDGQLGVLHGLDALENEGQLGHGAELVQHLPGVGDEDGVGAAHAVAGGALPAGAAGGVDGPDEGLGAGLLGAVKEDLVGRVVVVGVDLAEEDLVRCTLGRDLLDWERREG